MLGYIDCQPIPACADGYERVSGVTPDPASGLIPCTEIDLCDLSDERYIMAENGMSRDAGNIWCRDRCRFLVVPESGADTNIIKNMLPGDPGPT